VENVAATLRRIRGTYDRINGVVMNMMRSVRKDNGLLLGFCMMYRLNVLMFQRNILPPFSWWLNWFKWIMKWYGGRNISVVATHSSDNHAECRLTAGRDRTTVTAQIILHIPLVKPRKGCSCGNLNYEVTLTAIGLRQFCTPSYFPCLWLINTLKPSSIIIDTFLPLLPQHPLALIHSPCKWKQYIPPKQWRNPK
jgi:hypothetical protein